MDDTKAMSLLGEQVPSNKRQNDLKLESDSSQFVKKDKQNDLINNVNNKVLIDFLSPEISKNEFAKRFHKYLLIILLSSFLIIQFIAVYNITNKTINYAISETANIGILKNLLAFVSGYITSVVIELIAILKYIVKNVFDTSLVELVKMFKENKSYDNEQEN